MKKDETSKNDVILIPVEKLQEGFDLCRKQMELLIESAELLHQSKKYSISIALSVLAREESAKLSLIGKQIDGALGISKREWESITRGFVHEHKLKNPVKSTVDLVRSLSKGDFEKLKKRMKDDGTETIVTYEDVMNITEEHYKRLSSLNEIKKDCFYLNWVEPSWKIFFSRSKEQLEAVSFVELVHVKIILYGLAGLNLVSKKKDERFQTEFDEVQKKRKQSLEILRTKQFKVKDMIAWSVYKQYFKS